MASIKGLFASELPHGPSVALEADHSRDSGLRPCGSEGDPATECDDPPQRMFCTDTALDPLLPAHGIFRHRQTQAGNHAQGHPMQHLFSTPLRSGPTTDLAHPFAAIPKYFALISSISDAVMRDSPRSAAVRSSSIRAMARTAAGTRSNRNGYRWNPDRWRAELSPPQETDRHKTSDSVQNKSSFKLDSDEQSTSCMCEQGKCSEEDFDEM